MAMTFTNKAALEMKERVIKALKQLARQSDEDMRFVYTVSQSFEMPIELLRERAANTLSAILHNYSDLNIQTIDKFNVRLIRSFVRDLNMSNDFEVLVDTREFNEKVVDKFLDSIDSVNHNDLKNQLVVRFIESKLENEEQWGIRENLIEMLTYFEKELFIMTLPKLQEFDFSIDNLKQFIMQRDLCVQQFEKEKLQVLLPFLETYSYEDFKTEFGIKNWNNLYNYLNKHKKSELVSFVGFSEASLKAIDEFYVVNHSGLFFEKFREVDRFITNATAVLKEEYWSYFYAIRSFYQLALLKFLLQQSNQQKTSENKVLINEINNLISSQMRHEHADYIYERVGVRFDHFLLDEFQDTSRMQWLNLIPLVHNAMAQANTNLIVGDSKQAIYRFRNGVVEQFAELPKIYGSEKDIELNRISTYFENNALVDSLSDNWRSRKDIIEFNNKMFADLRGILHESYQSYYQDIDLKQNVINHTRGLIYIEVEETKLNNTADSDDELSEEDMAKDDKFLLERIQDVLSRGYQPGSICVLSRRNSHLSRWAKLLIEKGLEVTTDEGLTVSNSPKVRFIVSWLQLIFKPSSTQNQRDFALNYMLIFGDNHESDSLEFYKSKHFDFEAFLKKHLDGKQVYLMRYDNLYDLVIKILSDQNIDELSDPFLHFFCNLVQSFDSMQGPNLEKFLHYYDTRGKEKRVPLAEGNAIRLMTTHKSKGLEFPIVIMPDTQWEWSLRANNKHLFFDEPKNLFYLANISKNEKSTVLQKDLYSLELERSKLDVFNLFYVACTRAVDELHMKVLYSERSETSKSEPSKLSYFLAKYFNANFGQEAARKDESFVYVFGEPTQAGEQKFETSNLQIKLFGEKLWFPDISLIDGDALGEMSLKKERVLGRLIHAVLEHMQSPSDLQNALNSQKELLNIDQDMLDDIKNHLTEILNNEEIIQLIFPNPQLEENSLDEREIIISDKERIRPDRLILGKDYLRVIDYKTGIPRPKDIKQIEKYSDALAEMGYQNCSAYLIYTDALQLKQVR